MSAAKTTVKNVTWYRNLISSRYAIALVTIVCLFAPLLESSSSEDTRFADALRWILSPAREAVQYDYVMTAKVRLLLFWVGADDVGGGFIRRATSASDPKIRQTQVLFGSDPAKAPRHINHWGAATEAVNGNSSAFLGFMKSTKADSAADAEAEARKQTDQSTHSFEAILSVVQDGQALSRRAPLLFDTDFNLYQLEQAQGLALQRLKDDLRPRQLAGSELQCGSARGFLQAVDELIAQALTSGSTPLRSLCYVYNARNYTLRLDDRSRVASKTIRVQRKNNTKLEKTYRDLVDARFSVLNQTTREVTYFEMLLGTSGDLRGVPVQIIHQPNWWFQVVLNLDPK
jgi:hypothetical protein